MQTNVKPTIILVSHCGHCKDMSKELVSLRRENDSLRSKNVMLENNVKRHAKHLKLIAESKRHLYS